MNCLNMLKFKCRNEHCKDVHEYSKAMEHLKNCDLLLKPCTQKCGLGILGSDMNFHTKTGCKNKVVKCDTCEENTYPNKDVGEHNCVETLKT